MNIFLIQPPIRDFYRTAFREYPLGLIYLAAALEKHRHSVSLLDARLVRRPKKTTPPAALSHLSQYYTKENGLFLDYKHFGMTYEMIGEHVKALRPDAVCINAMFTPYVDSVIETGRTVKDADNNIRLLAGGYHATVDPESLRTTGLFDNIVMGEGEEALSCILNRSPDVIPSETKNPYAGNKKAGDSLASLRSAGDSSIASLPQNDINTVHRISNLDTLAFPARHLIDPDSYRFERRRYTMILTSRGCPHRCSFCSTHAVAGYTHRVRSIDNVIAEIEECVERHGIEVFDLQDDNLLFDVDRIKTLFEVIIRRFKGRGITLLASNGLNVAHMDGELLSLMKCAGFKKLDLSLGTGDVGARSGLKRPESILKYEFVLKAATDMDLSTTTYVILGIPTQPIAEMRATIAYLKTRPTLISPSIFYNVPGMPVFEEMSAYEYSHDHIARRSSAFNHFGIDFSRDDIFTLFKEVIEHNRGKQKG